MICSTTTVIVLTFGVKIAIVEQGVLWTPSF